MPSCCAISFRLDEVGLLSAAKYSSSLTSCSGLTRDRLRRCLTGRPSGPTRAEHEIARRMIGFSALGGTVAGGACGATSESVGDRAEERLGEDATDSGVSWTAARVVEALSGMERGARAARGLDSAGSCLTACAGGNG